MRLIGSFQTITTHGLSYSKSSSPTGSSTSVSAGATVIAAIVGRRGAGGVRSAHDDASPRAAAGGRRSAGRAALRLPGLHEHPAARAEAPAAPAPGVRI